jgi:hypothetical protein
LGSTYGAERWNTVSDAVRAAMRGTNWMALAPVPSTATRSPVRSCSWSHSAEWNRVPAKRSSPGTAGVDGRLSCPHAATTASASCTVPSDSASCHRPDGLVEGGRQHLGAQPDVRQHAEVAGDVAHVLLDLGLRGEPPRPVRLRGEREGVEVRRDVAGRARVGVGAPDAADVVAPLEQHEVLDAGLLQPDGGRHAAEAGSDDRHTGHAATLGTGPPAAHVARGQPLDTSGHHGA